MQAVAADAKSKGLDEVWVTTEVENEAALKLYLNSGFDMQSFLSVFHFS
jgi:ribosomal protein S18 acetylase RimI-like enzyme